jgi:hypothetical protein
VRFQEEHVETFEIMENALKESCLTHYRVFQGHQEKMAVVVRPSHTLNKLQHWELFEVLHFFKYGLILDHDDPPSNFQIHQQIMKDITVHQLLARCDFSSIQNLRITAISLSV